MSRNAFGMLVMVAGAVIAAGADAPGRGLEAARTALRSPPDEARVMMRWWWFGAAITPEQIDSDLEAMKAAGLGGVEVQPVYPLTLDRAARGDVNRPFLSDPFLDALGHAGRRAAALGLRLDLTLGSGWPYGGPTVGIEDAAGQLRVERIAVPAGTTRVVRPSMTAGESWVGAFIGPGTEPDAAAMTPLDWPADRDVLALTPADAARQVWALVSSRTGMMVKRPAVGAEGYVLSHYDRGALDRYLASVGDRLLRPLAGRLPFAIFCDSLEVYGSDWTADLPAEFQRRRGYDIVPLLPRLVADRGTEGARLREDWGETLTELHEARFIEPLAAWARERGTRLRMQGYGIPPASVSSNAAVDLPEGEGHHWREVTATRWAASASHLFDRPVASSETWTWLHSPSFRATPLDLKAEADRHFLQGITQLVGHGWPSTADGEAYPGRRFYAAGAFNERNPWWIAMPDIARYLQRVSAVLRQGRPGNDVALYLPVADGFARTSPGRMHLLDLVRERIGKELVGSILDAGYGLDFVDDGVLARASVEGGVLVLGASRFRAIVLPAVEAMPLRTLEALERFADGGGVVVATSHAPRRPAGRMAAASTPAFAGRAAALFSRADGRAVVVDGAGAPLRLALSDRLPPALGVADVPAAGGEAQTVPSDIGVIERRFDAQSVFFVVNTSNRPRTLRAVADAGGRVVERWDPMSASTSAMTTDREGGVTLALAPYQSVFLVRTARVGRPPRAVARRPAGAPVQRVIGPWTVEVDGTGWVLDGQAMAGWETRETTRHFSGIGVYRATVTLGAAETKGRRVLLDFGEGIAVAETRRTNGMRAWLDPPVREAAVIDVNDGRLKAALWAPPYRVDITEGIVAGENRIVVRVGNTAMNHMAGRPLPDHRLLTLRYGERFSPQDMDQVAVLPSGLIVPVRLVIE